MSSVTVPLFAGHSGGSPLSASPQRMYNYYPKNAPLMKGQVAWKNTPGWTLFAKLGSEEIRASIIFDNSLFVVMGDALISVSPANATGQKGTLTGGSVGRVDMATDGFTLVITDSTAVYLQNPGDRVLTEITTEDRYNLYLLRNCRNQVLNALHIFHRTCHNLLVGGQPALPPPEP